MKVRDCVLELCHEAGKTGSEEEVFEQWKAHHARCCDPHVDKAARGDVVILNKIRTCMGLWACHGEA